ncbi:hypothetical protein ACFQ3Z_24245 [Streptomyces nogalater]
MTPARGYLPEELERAQQRLDEMAQAQLGIARAQAEGWRNFLGAATGLLAAVLVLKGRENVAELPGGYRTAVIALVAAGLVLLLGAAFLAVSAAHGRPGDELRYAHAAGLLDWEERELDRIASRIGLARWAAVLGVLASAAGILLTWVAPAPDTPVPTVRVHTRGVPVRRAPRGRRQRRHGQGQTQGEQERQGRQGRQGGRHDPASHLGAGRGERGPGGRLPTVSRAAVTGRAAARSARCSPRTP